MAVLSLSFGGCGRESGAGRACLDAVAPAPDGRYVRAVAAAPDDDRARVVTFLDGAAYVVPRPPRRVVSMLPGLTEIVDVLGAGDTLVAVSEHCDTPSYVEELPHLAVLPVDYESLLALRPDLILTDATLHGAELEAMRRRGLRVLPLESSRSLAHLGTTVDLLAQVFDTPDAREAARRFGQELADALAYARPPADAPPPRVLLVAESSPLYVLGPGSLLDDMVRACGGIDVACDLGRASGPFAAELVYARRPDWILLTGGALSGLLRERWSALPALEADQVASVAGDAFVRAGPRSPGALRRLADVLRGRVPADRLGGDR